MRVRYRGRSAFFDFNLEQPGPGRVILNPDELKKAGKFESISLLIHETRHSAQLQMAVNHPTTLAGQVYHAAFQAQKKAVFARSVISSLSPMNSKPFNSAIMF